MYYLIKPKDKFSYSRRWVVDDDGLVSVKHHYENYLKDPNKPVNRLKDFIYGEVYNINVDFGGMLSLDEPNIGIKDGKSTFKMPVSHLETFIFCLKNSKISTTFIGEVSTIGMQWCNLCFSPETIQRLLPKALTRFKNCEEMIEGAERDFREKIARINSDKLRIISLEKKKEE
jgi:hypothetical protein